jgi:hypothetical protein
MLRCIQVSLPMSQLGHFRPINDVCAMSVFPPDRDKIAVTTASDVTGQTETSGPMFDHLVGSRQQRRRDFETLTRTDLLL